MLRSGPKYPSRIDEYVMLRLLGKGAFGHVYEASLLSGSSSRFAIKIIEKKKINSINGMVQRVKNEVTIHHQLRHPNILELYHFFEDSEKVYLVMELCANGELYQFMKKKPGPMAEEDAKRFFREIVKGVDYLHEHGIIHRDLKLSNILLDDSMRPKIADFGLAVRQHNPQTSEQKTLCGTPNYLAPEILSKKSYGAAADQWSLGCILYTILTGRPPFESSEVKNTFERVSRVQYDLPVWLSSESRDLISRLITHNPEERLTTQQILSHPLMTGRRPSSPVMETEPLNTKGLKPLRQQTKHGIFELLGSGHIWVDFMVDSTVTLISPDGRQVKCFDKGTSQKEIDETHPVASFVFPNLSPSKRKIYEYARKFVALMRSKTPRLIISTGKFRAFLMDNGPPSDFMIKYHDESLRAEFTAASGILRIFEANGEAMVIENPAASDLDKPQLTRATRAVLSEFLGRYQQAVTTLKRIRDEQDRGTLPFPFVVREHASLESGHTAFCNPTIQMMTLSEELVPHQQHVPLQQVSQHSVPTVRALEFSIAYKTFLTNVGWCLASACDQYMMLFIDGVSMLVDGKLNMIGYTDERLNRLEWLEINSSLPEFVKQRLTFFPRFVQLLKQASHSPP